MSNKNLYFDDNAETAHIDAVVKGRKFFDEKTGDELNLKEGARVKITVSVYSLEEKEIKSHREIKRNKILDKGEILHFKFYVPGEEHRLYEFKVTLLNDLYLVQKGNKFSNLELCRCLVEADRTREKFEADSLNQAFMIASIKYKPNNKSHTCNVFKTFFYKDRRLEDLRIL
ncbi:MAG: hypothetical protein G01um101429_1055 [Parcubacteria group bacterium Gr01-1014_29]|nr:MAG: hypothetical protein G01um101429_1055 [Parcubacteria group bacterium Gr01-1014_29]